ncbi:hypothetical protein A7A09_014495 [Paracoccus methylarcula]|uniref:Uncharacterized protein n=1 Tax=Paracoccus methylarcula TaxID=72022 RepID=A0A422QUI4_9RHOB|nr:hypothetical protein A7A09_014495 [Paracoccus methylarcula]
MRDVSPAFGRKKKCPLNRHLKISMKNILEPIVIGPTLPFLFMQVTPAIAGTSPVAMAIDLYGSMV